ncbi:hypothetical protein [Escherichia phage vB_EcoS_PHB17]|uniref:Uncharacterized protein n=1 Tax=Escherichia phage vB_EcoS_PHB17 TaxID=2591407 RepID=A0A514DKN6_9CAUD|nr:hypothetical protein KMB84_gp06 [Escherichia phage vB_EcoS_PHB17]QDH94209.1 hypothetical protein [Escherichia phage vB_EcoS_PHB17]
MPKIEIRQLLRLRRYLRITTGLSPRWCPNVIGVNSPSPKPPCSVFLVGLFAQAWIKPNSSRVMYRHTFGRGNFNPSKSTVAV